MQRTSNVKKSRRWQTMVRKEPPEMPVSLFCVGRLPLGVVLRALCIPTEAPLERTDFPFELSTRESSCVRDGILCPLPLHQVQTRAGLVGVVTVSVCLHVCGPAVLRRPCFLGVFHPHWLLTLPPLSPPPLPLPHLIHQGWKYLMEMSHLGLSVSSLHIVWLWSLSFHQLQEEVSLTLAKQRHPWHYASFHPQSAVVGFPRFLAWLVSGSWPPEQY